jgi:hypothetical protein
MVVRILTLHVTGFEGRMDGPARPFDLAAGQSEEFWVSHRIASNVEIQLEGEDDVRHVTIV